MIGYILTTEQKNQIEGKEYAKGKKFAAVEISADKWVVDEKVVDEIEGVQYKWIKDLKMTAY